MPTAVIVQLIAARKICATAGSLPVVLQTAQAHVFVCSLLLTLVFVSWWEISKKNVFQDWSSKYQFVYSLDIRLDVLVKKLNWMKYLSYQITRSSFTDAFYSTGPKLPAKKMFNLSTVYIMIRQEVN